MQVQRVGDVAPSPDGKRALWTQTRLVMETDKSEPLTQIFFTRPDGTRVQLTRGDKSAQAPAFSPDGRFVFFTSDRNGKKNLYRIPVDGGEAEMLTDWKGTLGAYHVSPDGKWVAFTGAEADPDEEKAKKEKRDFHVVDEKPRNLTLWVIPVDADAHGKRPHRKLVNAGYHIGSFDWSRDNRWIAFDHTPTPDAEEARKSDVGEVEVESAKVKEIAQTESNERQPRYSPDGRYLAYVKSAAKGGTMDPDRVVLFTRQNGELRPLAATPEESPALLGWAGDSKKLYVSEAKSIHGAVYALPVDGPATVAYVPQRGALGFGMRLNEAGTHLGFTYETSTDPAEAYVFEVAAGKPGRVSAANTDLPKPPLGETKAILWRAKDGKEIEGVLTLPVGYEKGKRYPMVLVIHGGPAGVFTDSFIGAPALYPFASFAAKGYAVLRCNIRGSVGYGRGFRASNFKDWGGGDYQDLMSGVDYVINQGIADADKLAVMGWSYGGYMTSWVISQTTRFKAAAIGAGITNVWSMWGTNDIPSVLDDYFGGSPWDEPELYMQRSGLYHVKNVTTPTLFLHGEADNRVPISQAFEYYHALKRRGVTTKMVTYPRTPHGPQEPKFMLDIMQRHLDWVEKYVR